MAEAAIIVAKYAPDMIEYLSKRRSTPIKTLQGPGPNEAQLRTMLQIATRVPDHNKLCPWYLLTFTGDARGQAGQMLRDIFVAKNPGASAEEIAIEENRFLRAPVVVAVVSRRRHGKAPWWEQILSTGAVAYNLTLAAQAHGFGAVWLTEWLAYDDNVKRRLGLDLERDQIAGFVYIGSVTEMPVERERPDLANIVTAWQPGITPNTGDMYDRTEFGLPPKDV